MKRILNYTYFFLIYIFVKEGDILGISLASTSFNGTINKKYVCETQGGKNLSPRLIISEVPKETKALILIMEDPDAKEVVGKTYIHLIAQLEPQDQDLAEGGLNEKSLKKGIKTIKNDKGTLGYDGPCPPNDKTHNYFFTLIALKESFDFSENTPDYFRNTWDYKNKDATSRFYNDNKDNVVGITKIVGKFKKKSKK